MEKLLKALNKINWDFSDYSSLKYPLDINSIPWYPATLPPPIPKFLVALLSSENEVVLDPFGGKGTVAIESLKQNRRFHYNDLNPFATDITSDIIKTLRSYILQTSDFKNIYENESDYFKQERERICTVDTYLTEQINEGVFPELGTLKEKLCKEQLDGELIYWYHIDTLLELMQIFQLMKKDQDSQLYPVRKLAFVSILKEVCSQKGHFTYVTDNCRPKIIVYIDAISAYLNMMDRILRSILDFRAQFSVNRDPKSILTTIDESVLHCGDSRSLSHIADNSVDLVITSPPYLCAQDYIKTMRLTNFFFTIDNFGQLAKEEIGARNQRRGKAEKVVNQFYDDMNLVFAELSRVLKDDGFLCLVIGQGKSRITQGYDTIQDIANIAMTEHGFSKVFFTERKISYKSVRIGGVDSERILIFQKKG